MGKVWFLSGLVLVVFLVFMVVNMAQVWATVTFNPNPPVDGQPFTITSSGGPGTSLSVYGSCGCNGGCGITAGASPYTVTLAAGQYNVFDSGDSSCTSFTVATTTTTTTTSTTATTQVASATGTGTVAFTMSPSTAGGFTIVTASAVSSVSSSPPAGLTFPYGLFSFTIGGLAPGATVTVTLTLPVPLPAGSFSYWKFQSGVWTQFPSASLDSTRTVITLTFTADASGTVTDPGGPAITPPSASTTTVNCIPSSVAVGSGSTCTATVTGSSPTGTVSFTQSTPGTGTVTFSPSSSCTLTSGSCSVTATGSSVGSGSVTVTGSYGGDSNNLESSGTFSLQVITPAIIPEYPLGLPLLAIFMVIGYGLIRRRTRN